MHGSLNGYRKSHPLRERARKLSQGILIIRFEMPYNIWCDGCKNHIGMAYEDRQRLKRREISARSWFPSPVADRASDTLKRLGLTLGSTSAPSLGSPSCSTALPVGKGLGIVRRRSVGSDITAAQEPEASLGVRESDTPRGNDMTDAPGGGGTPFDSAQAQTPSAETQAGGCFGGEAEPCTPLPLTSLVADYWGSSSESES
ncbi:UNVERIFIED_CONTAM: hypothetical protein FKN15_021862 [Acipenser sinensis]